MNAGVVASQEDITAEIAAIAAEYRRTGSVAGDPTQPRLDYPPYRSSALRHPKRPPLIVDPEELERWAPASAARTSTRSTPT